MLDDEGELFSTYGRVAYVRRPDSPSGPVDSMRLTRPHRFQPVADDIIAGGRFPRTIAQSADLR